MPVKVKLQYEVVRTGENSCQQTPYLTYYNIVFTLMFDPTRHKDAAIVFKIHGGA